MLQIFYPIILKGRFPLECFQRQDYTEGTPTEKSDSSSSSYRYTPSDSYIPNTPNARNRVRVMVTRNAEYRVRVGVVGNTPNRVRVAVTRVTG